MNIKYEKYNKSLSDLQSKYLSIFLQIGKTEKEESSFLQYHKLLYVFFI